ncbi:hypothetical protein [Tessaracoccus defluvii]|uniref:Uncharacterized protein n=1 Tax=Tessaracoccus defluvii TaxID=1285901 RepID=A0A7H0H466_9ACTN|nr:hypothetical protein [Tessaracoccus defluvii]QNP55332.1 hypothetical protein H9L22_14060 [Tessaracoccus defluvii]
MADSLSPEQALKNWAAAGKFIVATAALLVTVASGFGLTWPAAGRWTQSLLLANVVLAVLAITCSLAFLFPATREIQIRDLVAVEEWFAKVRGRAWLLGLAAVLVALQAACLPVAVGVNSQHREDPIIAFGYSGEQGRGGRPSVWLTVGCERCAENEYEILLQGKQAGVGEPEMETVLAVLVRTDDSGRASYASGDIETERFDAWSVLLNGQPVASLEVR